MIVFFGYVISNAWSFLFANTIIYTAKYATIDIGLYAICKRRNRKGLLE